MFFKALEPKKLQAAEKGLFFNWDKEGRKEGREELAKP